MKTENGIGTLMLVGIMAVILVAFGVTLFATKQPTNVNSNAAANITNVQIPILRTHNPGTLKTSSTANINPSLTPGAGDDLDAALNDLNNENLDETTSDMNDINTQASTF